MEICRLWDRAKVQVLELGGGVCGHGDGFREEDYVELGLKA